MATTSIESSFSTWIDERGYNFFGNSGVVAIGRTYTTSGSVKTYRTKNAFSVFPGIGEGTVISGRIEFYFDMYLSDQPEETFTAYDMNSPMADLLVPHTATEINPAIFEDTHTGSLLGQAVYGGQFPGADQFVQMELTPAAIDWLNGIERESPFAIGFSVNDLGANDYVMLQYATVNGLAPRLILEVVPEVSSILLTGIAVVGICLRRMRR